MVLDTPLFVNRKQCVQIIYQIMTLFRWVLHASQWLLDVCVLQYDQDVSEQQRVCQYVALQQMSELIQ